MLIIPYTGHFAVHDAVYNAILIPIFIPRKTQDLYIYIDTGWFFLSLTRLYLSNFFWKLFLYITLYFIICFNITILYPSPLFVKTIISFDFPNSHLGFKLYIFIRIYTCWIFLSQTNITQAFKFYDAVKYCSIVRVITHYSTSIVRAIIACVSIPPCLKFERLQLLG